MEDVDCAKGEYHNSVGVVIKYQKGEYELARDMNVVSIAYLWKSLENAL